MEAGSDWWIQTVVFFNILYLLDILRPVNHEESNQGETKCIPTTSKIMIHNLITHSTVENLEKLGENEVEWATKAETRYVV